MKLVDIIKNFISQENSDFAILINGSWGSGKTFFLKRVVAEEVKKISCKLSATDSKPFELVYVSLYGLTSADELQRRLFLEINPSLKTKGGKIITSLLGKGLEYIGLGASDKDEKNLLNIFGGIPKNKILVFDDLERLATETINEVLGFINTYTEHQNLKVIIVADEEKIKAKIDDYDKVKEKLIRFTYLFNPELKEVFPSFVARYTSVPYQQFLTANSNLICDLFTKGQHKNLRSLRFVLDLFEAVFVSVNSIADLDETNKKVLLDRFLFFVTTYSIEYKKDDNDENLTALKNIGNSLSSSAFDMLLFKQMRSEMIEKGEIKEDDISPMEKFTMQFEETYFPDGNSNFEYYDFLTTFIHSGDLDSDELRKVCLTSQEILKEKQGKPEHIALGKLKNCLTLNDNEYLPVIEEIYSYVDSGVYKLEEYPIIFQNLLNGSKEGIANLVIDAASVDRFKAGMEKSLAHSQYRNGFENYISIWHQTDEILQSIRDYAVELNETLLTDSDKQLSDKVFALLVPEKLSEFTTLMMSDEVKSVPICQESYISPEEFINKYDALSNSEKLTVYEVFNNFSSRFIHYRQVFVKEITFYQKTLEIINQKIQAAEGNKQLSTNIHQRFKHWLEETIKKLQNIAGNHFE